MQKAIVQGSEIVYVRWLDDAAPEDPDAVRNRVDATQVNTHGREDVVLATLPIKASRIILAHYNTKIMPHIGPTVFAGEMIEGHHSYRRRRRSPRKSEWESNSKQVNDMTDLSRRKLDSKRTPTPLTKATAKGRRYTDDELDQLDVRASREVAGTGASATGASSIQFVAFVVNPGETGVFNFQADPKTLYVYMDTVVVPPLL